MQGAIADNPALLTAAANLETAVKQAQINADFLAKLSVELTQKQTEYGTEQQKAAAQTGTAESEAAKRSAEETKKALEEKLKVARDYAENVAKMQKGETAYSLAGSYSSPGRHKIAVDREESLGPMQPPPQEDLFAAAYAKIAADAMDAFHQIQNVDAVTMEAIINNGDNVANAFKKQMADRAATFKKEMEEEKKSAEEQARVQEQIARSFQHSFESAFDGVIRGTETVKFAFYKLAGDILLSVIHSQEEMVAKRNCDRHCEEWQSIRKPNNKRRRSAPPTKGSEPRWKNSTSSSGLLRNSSSSSPSSPMRGQRQQRRLRLEPRSSQSRQQITSPRSPCWLVRPRREHLLQRRSSPSSGQ